MLNLISFCIILLHSVISFLIVNILILVLNRYIGKGDGITISIWNHKKVQKKQGGGFLGCVRILSGTIQKLKDTGCEYMKKKTWNLAYSLWLISVHRKF